MACNGTTRTINSVGFDLGAPIAYPAYNRSSNEDLEQLRDDVEQAGGQALVYGGDVRKAHDVEEAVSRAVDRFGHIDIVFSNAGICA